MKIAGIIFESLLKTGGYEIFTYNLHKALARRGHDVTLYLPAREVRKRRAFYSGLPFAVRPLIPQTSFFLRNAPGLLQRHLAWQQIRHGYDVWQVMGTWPEGFAALRVNAPKVLRNYGEDIQLSHELNYGIRRDPALDHAVRSVLKSMDKVVAMTDSLAALQRELGVPEANIARIPNGISLERFRKPVDRAKVRARWHVGPEDFVLLTVGRNHPKKGFDLIPKLAHRIRDAGAKFVWLVLGGETDNLLPELRRLNLENMVRPMHAIGGSACPSGAAHLELPVDDLLDIYGMCDLFVFPSRLEGFSRVIIEALAAGLPVVTTNAPGCGEVLRHGRHGFVSPVEDIDDMADNVLRLIEDPGLLARFSSEARIYAEDFDWDRIAAAYENQYRKLTGKK